MVEAEFARRDLSIRSQSTEPRVEIRPRGWFHLAEKHDAVEHFVPASDLRMLGDGSTQHGLAEPLTSARDVTEIQKCSLETCRASRSTHDFTVTSLGALVVMCLEVRSFQIWVLHGIP